MSLPSRTLVAVLALLALGAPRLAAADPPSLWPEEQRAFFLDGPAWLLGEGERASLAEMDEAARADFIDSFLSAASAPGITADELARAIERRRALVRSEFLSPRDVRARLLFVRGTPTERLVVDCGETFEPLEIWSWDPPETDPKVRDEIVVFKPGAGRPWKLWTPYDDKRALYISEMEYYLEQWEEGNGRLFNARRFDLQSCKEARDVDRATGIEGLHHYRRGRPDAEHYRRFLAPPADLAAWVQGVLAEPAPERPPALEAGPAAVVFPERQGQRLVARFSLRLPAASALETAPSEKGEGERELRLVVEGVIEQGDAVFDDFRVRFVLPPPPEGKPLALVFDQLLRPDQVYLARFRVTDEVGGRAVYRVVGFRAPSGPQEVPEPPVPEEAIVALGQSLAGQQIAGKDSLVLVPPASDVVLNTWRADVVVTGQRIEKVVFSVDGEAQLTDNRAPYSAELRLARFPTEQVVRAEGLDASEQPVAADEVVINQPRGALAVRITDPPTGAALHGDVDVRAQVVVPEGRRVESVVFQVGSDEVARLEHPPWQARVRVPEAGGLSYLSVKATLDDGHSAEDVRLLNAPDYVEQVDVDLVELYAAVTDRAGRPVKGLAADDFEVSMEGQPVTLSRFEAVENLPLTVGITIDTSGSMASSLVEAQKAARDFLFHVLGVKDHAFAVGFADQPILLIPPTTDIDAVADSLVAAARGRLDGAPRRGGDEPLLLPRLSRPARPGPALGRRRHQEHLRLPRRARVRAPERRGDLHRRPGRLHDGREREEEAPGARHRDRRPLVLHRPGERALERLQGDRGGAAQPLPARLPAAGGDRPRLPRGGGQGPAPRPRRADGPGRIPVAVDRTPPGARRGGIRNRPEAPRVGTTAEPITWGRSES